MWVLIDTVFLIFSVAVKINEYAFIKPLLLSRPYRLIITTLSTIFILSLLPLQPYPFSSAYPFFCHLAHSLQPTSPFNTLPLLLILPLLPLALAQSHSNRKYYFLRRIHILHSIRSEHPVIAYDSSPVITVSFSYMYRIWFISILPLYFRFT